MVTADKLSENSRQGSEVQKHTCVGLESDLGQNLRWGCGHIYDETPVDIAVYVRNDPVNLVDPDGKDYEVAVTVWGSSYVASFAESAAKNCILAVSPSRFTFREAIQYRVRSGCATSIIRFSFS
jgi:hypothetical protein